MRQGACLFYRRPACQLTPLNLCHNSCLHLYPSHYQSSMLLHETSLKQRQNILQGARPVAHETSESDSYFTVSVQLNKLFTTPKCTTKECNSASIVTADHGALQTRCARCDTLVASAAAPHHPRDSSYSVIKLIEVYSSLISGIGYNGVRLNETLLTRGKMNNKTFHKYCGFQESSFQVLYRVICYT